MICFEVYRNGKKLFTAGVGQYGAMFAILSFVRHHPKKLAKWAAEGRGGFDQTELTLDVSGVQGDNGRPREFVKWIYGKVDVGDEITVRIVDLPSSDRLRSKRQDGPKKVKAAKKQYVKEYAKEAGLEVRPKRASKKSKTKSAKKANRPKKN